MTQRDGSEDLKNDTAGFTLPEIDDPRVNEVEYIEEEDDVLIVEPENGAVTKESSAVNNDLSNDQPTTSAAAPCTTSILAKGSATMSWGAANPYSEAYRSPPRDIPEGQQQACTSATATGDAEEIATELAVNEDLLGGTVCVFYTNSPFSDFAPFPFIVDGRYYYTLEHYFQVQMLYAFGLFKLASECLRIPDALEFRAALKKGLRELVKEGTLEESSLTKWKATNTCRVLRKGNKAKFEQNYQLKQILMHTDERLLIFANSKDRLLGVGMTEAEFLIWAQKNEVTLEDLIEIWAGRVRRPRDLGQNLLALTLMEVRAEIIRKPSVISEWKHTHKDLGLPPLIKRFEALETDDKKKVESLQRLIAENARNPEQLRPLPIKLKKNAKPQTHVELEDPTDTAFAMGRWFDERPYHRSPSRRRSRSRSRTRSPAPSGENNKPVPKSDGHTIDTADWETQVKEPEPEKTAEEIEQEDEKRREENRKHAEYLAERSKNAGAKRPQSWRTATGGAAEKNYHPDSVIGRLMKRTTETAMINPFTITSADAGMPDDNEPDDVRHERELVEEQLAEEAAMSMREPVYRRPPGSVYHLEPGEICPPGVVAPPEGVDQPAVLLPIHMRPGTDFITRQPVDYNTNPAALPPELLPLPLMPRNFEQHPYQWRDRFPGAPRRMPRNDCPLHIDKYPMWAPRPRLIEAPPEDPDLLRKVWEPCKNPVADALRQAKSYMDNVKRMIMQKRRGLLEDDEGATPGQLLRTRKRRYSAGDCEPQLQAGVEGQQEEEDVGAGALPAFTDDDQLLAAFLAKRMLANKTNWLELRLMGYNPPPIVGDPRAQMRNKRIPEQRGAVRFVNREAALRHAANRWCRQGKLGSTGKYFDMPDEADDEDDEPVDFSLRLEDPEDGKYYPPRPKKPVETQIIYVDTSRYEEYVRWYQKLHGFVPLPETAEYLHHERLRAFYQSYRANMDMLMCEPTDAELFFGENEAMKGIEKVMGHRAWGEHWAMSRHKWADWERRVDRGEHIFCHETTGKNFARVFMAHVIDLAQKSEVKDEGASVAARPLKYECIDLTGESDEPDADTHRVAQGVADLVFAKLEPTGGSSETSEPQTIQVE